MNTSLDQELLMVLYEYQHQEEAYTKEYYGECPRWEEANKAIETLKEYLGFYLPQERFDE